MYVLQTKNCTSSATKTTKCRARKCCWVSQKSAIPLGFAVVKEFNTYTKLHSKWHTKPYKIHNIDCISIYRNANAISIFLASNQVTRCQVYTNVSTACAVFIVCCFFFSCHSCILGRCVVCVLQFVSAQMIFVYNHLLFRFRNRNETSATTCW